ncbi:hypothetical protein Gpo141_00002241 [Globisporangium polare]
MARFSTTWLLSTAFALQSSLTLVTGSPLEYNPYTPVGKTVTLDASHPAFGAKLPTTSVAYRAMARSLPDSLADLLTTAAESVKATGTSERSTDSANSEAGVVFAASYENVAVGAPTSVRKLEVATSEDLARLETFFGVQMTYRFSDLPRNGGIDPIPWPSSYWPIFQDSINYKWDKKQASPAEKYAKAFGKDVKAFMTKVSENNGVLSQASKKACSSDFECIFQGDGSLCAKREGQQRGYCIPTWFGICHAWAPAALLEPEPICPVTKNGVTFQPFDIKALVSMAYDGAHIDTVFTGTRFNGKDSEANNKDQYGRFKDLTRRDIGAGFFHIAAANMLGNLNHSFVVDVTAGSEVWNQPVRSYQVLEATAIDPAQAGRKYFKTNNGYPFNPAATKLMFVKTLFKWIVESSENGPLVSNPTKIDKSTKSAEYTYILELDDDENILGGEWVDKSQENHPDFLWFPVAKPSMDTVTAVGLEYKDVSELLDASIEGRC